MSGSSNFIRRHRQRAERRALMQADHVGNLPEHLMQRMLRVLRVARVAEVERAGDLLVALRGGERDGAGQLHGVFLLLFAVLLAVILLVIFAVILALRGARSGSAGHRSMRTTGRMTTVQRAPRILPAEMRQRSRGNAMIMVRATAGCVAESWEKECSRQSLPRREKESRMCGWHGVRGPTAPRVTETPPEPRKVRGSSHQLVAEVRPQLKIKTNQPDTGLRSCRVPGTRLAAILRDARCAG